MGSLPHKHDFDVTKKITLTAIRQWYDSIPAQFVRTGQSEFAFYHGSIT